MMYLNEDENLYETLFADNDLADNDDLGLNMLNEIHSHLDFDLMSNYYSIDKYNRSLPKDTDNLLSIMHFNIRSCKKNFDTLRIILESLSHKPDVICLSETWLTDINMHCFFLEGFIAYHIIRPDRKARGGVSCFVNENIPSDRIEELSFVNKHIEVCTIKLSLSNESYAISTVYRPSDTKYSDIDNFETQISNITRNNLIRKCKQIFIGDFNINALEHTTHVPTNDFLNFMQASHFLPLISRPTRFPEGNHGIDYNR